MVPAAVACCVREQWLYFWFGWLTLGLLWYIGALGRKPGQPAYERRQVAIALGATAAACLALGLFGARPSAVLGVDGRSLQNSVGDEFLVGSDRDLLGADGDCEREEGRIWRCSRWDGELSGEVPYRVKVNSAGCWQARSIGFAAEGAGEGEVSGCVTLYDFILG